MDLYFRDVGTVTITPLMVGFYVTVPLIGQKGDINIVADFAVIKPRHLLSHLTYDELLGLIRNGERATWPKIETIRVCTKIARVLDDILESTEERELGLAKRAIAASHIA